MDEEKIKKAAKALMDDFMAAMEEIDESDEQVGIERIKSTREASESELSPGFSEKMLANTQKTKDGYVVSEKKKW